MMDEHEEEARKRSVRDLLQINDEEKEEPDYDRKNDEWFKQNYLYLIQDYPFLWIAVLDQKVVATATSKAGVEQKARKAMGDKKYSFYFIEPSDIRIGLS